MVKSIATPSLKYSRTSEMQIGKIAYIVTAHYKPNGRETAEDKLLRLVVDLIEEYYKNPIKAEK